MYVGMYVCGYALFEVYTLSKWVCVHGDLLPMFTSNFIIYLLLFFFKASCYFATKSLDEFLYLQQSALLEISRVIQDCGCKLAVPTTDVQVFRALVVIVAVVLVVVVV